MLESTRASSAAAMLGMGTPSVRPTCAVHWPVPFCPALSSTASTRKPPPFGSRTVNTSAVSSMRNDSNGPRFQAANTSASASGLRPPARCSTSYASAMSCMSAYSMPLCTILTKWPAPSGPHMRDARSGIGLRRDRFEDRRECGVGVLGAARHDRRAVAGAVFSARDAGADEPQARGRVGFFAALRVFVPRVAAVDDDVAGRRAAAADRPSPDRRGRRP